MYVSMCTNERERAYPEGRVADVAEAAPAPAVLGPVGAVEVPALGDELVEVAIGNLVLARLERLDLHGLGPVLVVPPEGGEARGLAQRDLPALDAGPFGGGVIDAGLCVLIGVVGGFG